MGKYAEGPVQNRFCCAKCRKWLRQEEIHFDFNIHKRTGTGNLDPTGSFMLCRPCAKKEFGPWLRQQSLYWNTTLREYEDILEMEASDE